MIRCTSVCLCALAIAAAAGHASAEQVWAVDSTSDSLYVFDTVSGEVVRTVGRLHPDTGRYATPIGMAIRPSDGAIFVKNNSPTADDGISIVDPETGLATYIGGEFVDGAITFDDAGTLYGTDNLLQVVTVDPATGEMTDLPGPSLPRLFGMDFRSADGFLYGIAWSFGNEPELYKIDPADGTVDEIIPLSGGAPTMAAPGALLFDSAGRLKATSFNGDLYTIDPDTGVVSDLITADAGPQGLGLIVGDCYADCDETGDLDFFDFLCFQNQFAAGDPEADCDGTGTLDFFDFLCFQNAFAAGCP